MVVDSRTSVPKYQDIQQQFANYIRDPASNMVPSGVEKRRMDIYKRLFFNNISSFCTKSFKSFRPFVDDEHWNEFIREFLQVYTCTSPYFKDIPLAFVEYLSHTNKIADEHPFMVEMCHLDAIKMQLRLAPDPPHCDGLGLSDKQTGLWLSPTVRLLSYEWPVHKITPSNWDGMKPKRPTWLIAFRDRHDRVEVLTTNAHTFRMLELMDDPITFRVLTRQLSREFEVSRPVLQNQIIPTIQAFQKKNVVLTVSIER